jgi:hypothetical protein
MIKGMDLKLWTPQDFDLSTMNYLSNFRDAEVVVIHRPESCGASFHAFASFVITLTKFGFCMEKECLSC